MPGSNMQAGSLYAPSFRTQVAGETLGATVGSSGAVIHFLSVLPDGEDRMRVLDIPRRIQ
jgi:hypothetical protein